MTSLFVKRMVEGRNRSIARVEVPGLPPVVASREFADYEETVAALRRDSWDEHLGFVRADASWCAGRAAGRTPIRRGRRRPGSSQNKENPRR